ncbi:MAG: ATP-binding protein [Phycisphaerae bacterium]|nr:ATP-binding protein [Phycisphaerae bacterium]
MDPLKIGQVVRVDGDNIEVQITVNDLVIDYHGTQYRVGRLGTYITVPIENCTLIGYVTKCGVSGELEPGPNPQGPRRLSLHAQLLGTIKADRFSRGVSEYPTIGDSVRLGVDEDFELIFGTFEEVANKGGVRKSFSMGRFAVDNDFEVRVLGKEFFAKHVAVMGNSGSGKSCTTAKIVYEALRLPESQVVMFDMHGEYLNAFSGDDGKPLPNVTYLSDRNLILPYWMLGFEEFERLFLDTSNPQNETAQRIFLRDAFRKLKLTAAKELNLEFDYSVETPVYFSIEQLKMLAENLNEARYLLNSENYAFSRLPFRQLPPDEQEHLLLTRRMEFNKGNAEGETPHATFHGRLLGFVNLLESRLNDPRYDFILKPFEQVKRNPELAPYFKPEMGARELSGAVASVLRQVLGRLGGRKNLTIIDLSGLPFDVVDVTVAVMTRALFEFNFWTPVENRQPTLIVYEEAHNYLPRKPIANRKTFAREAVEKVAKEGRKYGVSAMVVSQRPSEISETLLSQCNSMVLMRMNNPDDQEYAARVVSDQFRSLISLLPSLKPGEGFVIGDSVLMPMRTLIDLPPRLPRSNDVDFFGLWSQGAKPLGVETIVQRWWRKDRTAFANEAGAGTTDPPRVAPGNARGPMAGGGGSSISGLPQGTAANGLPNLVQPRQNPTPPAGPQPPVSRGPEASMGSAGGSAEPSHFVPDPRPGQAGHAGMGPARSMTAAQQKLADLAKKLSGTE